MKKTGGSGPGDSLQIRSGKEQGNFHHRMMVSRKPTFFFWMVPEMTSEKKDFDSVFKTKDVPLTLSNVHIVSHLSVRLFSVPPSPQFTERQKKINS